MSLPDSQGNVHRLIKKVNEKTKEYQKNKNHEISIFFINPLIKKEQKRATLNQLNYIRSPDTKTHCTLSISLPSHHFYLFFSRRTQHFIGTLLY